MRKNNRKGRRAKKCGRETVTEGSEAEGELGRKRDERRVKERRREREIKGRLRRIREAEEGKKNAKEGRKGDRGRRADGRDQVRILRKRKVKGKIKIKEGRGIRWDGSVKKERGVCLLLEERGQERGGLTKGLK